MCDIEPILGLNLEKIDLDDLCVVSQQYLTYPVTQTRKSGLEVITSRFWTNFEKILVSKKKSKKQKVEKKLIFEKKSSPGPNFGPKMA